MLSGPSNQRRITLKSLLPGGCAGTAGTRPPARHPEYRQIYAYKVLE